MHYICSQGYSIPVQLFKISEMSNMSKLADMTPFRMMIYDVRIMDMDIIDIQRSILINSESTTTTANTRMSAC